MKIIKKIWQYRRDFKAEVECEGCGFREEINGYDDDYFHKEVMPILKCPKCGKSRNDLGIKSEPLKPKYPEGMQI